MPHPTTISTTSRGGSMGARAEQLAETAGTVIVKARVAIVNDVQDDGHHEARRTDILEEGRTRAADRHARGSRRGGDRTPARPYRRSSRACIPRAREREGRLLLADPGGVRRTTPRPGAARAWRSDRAAGGRGAEAAAHLS